MDDDRSNSLNFNEFKKGIHDYGCDMTKEEVQEMFTSIDRDGSGTLDFEEFLQALRVSVYKPPLSEWSQHNDYSYDNNCILHFSHQ